MATITAHKSSIDLSAIRKDFPILEREMRGKPMVFLDLSLIHIPSPRDRG